MLWKQRFAYSFLQRTFPYRNNFTQHAIMSILIPIQVNLHILGIIPGSCENYVLANQIRCLAMLFDLNFGGSDERKKIASIVNMRIGEPTRSVRGRDRRMAIYWKST